MKFSRPGAKPGARTSAAVKVRCPPSFRANRRYLMSDNTISILDGSTFLVSSANGDIEAGPNQAEGFFYKDMRHLSKWKLTVNGIPLDVLSTDATEYYYAHHFS